MLPVKPPELAVAVTVRVLVPIFLPHQLQRHRGLAHVRRDRRPVGLRPRWRQLGLLEQQRLDLRLAFVGDVLVAHAGRFGPRQIIAHRGAAQPHRLCDLPQRVAQFVGQPQNFLHTSHVRPFPRHSPPPAKAEENVNRLRNDQTSKSTSACAAEPLLELSVFMKTGVRFR